MQSTTLIIGGCRSGKSSHALTIGEAYCKRENIFVATCQPYDDEMKIRIARHQKERGDHWRTVEAPLDPDRIIREQGPRADIMLIDCLTLWVSNLMMAHDDDKKITAAFEQLHQAVIAPPCPIILVSNEVGQGIVPENAMARRFRDLTGWCNQKMAAGCNQVIWMVAGIPVPVKNSNV